jgi:opacity protein-like surface antigen
MRKAILGSVSALALASPAVAADLPVQPRYRDQNKEERICVKGSWVQSAH